MVLILTCSMTDEVHNNVGLKTNGRRLGMRLDPPSSPVIPGSISGRRCMARQGWHWEEWTPPPRLHPPSSPVIPGSISGRRYVWRGKNGPGKSETPPPSPRGEARPSQWPCDPRVNIRQEICTCMARQEWPWREWTPPPPPPEARPSQ